jgi:hypothetical protein
MCTHIIIMYVHVCIYTYTCIFNRDDEINKIYTKKYFSINWLSIVCLFSPIISKTSSCCVRCVHSTLCGCFSAPVILCIWFFDVFDWEKERKTSQDFWLVGGRHVNHDGPRTMFWRCFVLWTLGRRQVTSFSTLFSSSFSFFSQATA